MLWYFSRLLICEMSGDVEDFGALDETATSNFQDGILEQRV